jgi:hypothetical protein
MRQKGGAFTLQSGQTMTAEELLDRFSNSYFEKHSITLPQSIYDSISRFLYIGEDRGLDELELNGWFWFNKQDNEGGEQGFLNAKTKQAVNLPPLMLEDTYLNFEGIEDRVYIKLTKIEGASNSRGKPIYGVGIPTAYAIKNIADKKNPFPAYKPFIKKENNDWVLYYMKGSIPTTTNLKSNKTDPKEAITDLISEYIGVNGVDESQLSAFSETGADISDRSKIDNLITNNKLIIQTSDKFLKVYYAEPKNTQGTEWQFHPHNLTNFLPSTYYENQFKLLYTMISKRLDELKVSKNHKFLQVPDNFFHIHVSNIPNEQTILLTIHALSEILYRPGSNQEKNFKNYTYKNKNGTYKLHREISIQSMPHLNMENSRSSNAERLRYKNIRKDHSAYILLKPGVTKHSLYKLSNKNQYGNPFFVPNAQTFINFGMYINSFALGSNSFATTKFDINHIKNKGVILTNSGARCSIFCDDKYYKKDENQKNLKHQFEDIFKSSSSPMSMSNLKPYQEELVQQLSLISGDIYNLNDKNNHNNENNYNLTRLLPKRMTKRKRRN